jgi:hypothetical protein
VDNSWVIFVEIIIAGVIFGFLFFRRKPKGDSDAGVRRVELKLSGAVLTPAVISVSFNHSTQLIVHRFDAEPAEELFEIDDLKVYALLPAFHSIRSSAAPFPLSWEVTARLGPSPSYNLALLLLILMHLFHRRVTQKNTTPQSPTGGLYILLIHA